MEITDLMIALARRAIAAQFGLSPKSVFASFAVIPFGVAAALATVFRTGWTNGVAVTLALGARGEMPPG